MVQGWFRYWMESSTFPRSFRIPDCRKFCRKTNSPSPANWSPDRRKCWRGDCRPPSGVEMPPRYDIRPPAQSSMWDQQAESVGAGVQRRAVNRQIRASAVRHGHSERWIDCYLSAKINHHLVNRHRRRDRDRVTVSHRDHPVRACRCCHSRNPSRSVIPFPSGRRVPIARRGAPVITGRLPPRRLGNSQQQEQEKCSRQPRTWCDRDGASDRCRFAFITVGCWDL